MSARPIHIVFATGLLVLCLLAAAPVAGAEPVQLSELSPAAQTAIRQQVGAAKLGEITKSIEKGEVVYEVEMTAQRKTRSFTVNDEGELVAVEVFLGEISRPLQKAVRAHLGKGVLGDISKITEDGVVTYEVEMTHQGKTRSFTLGTDGKLLETQLFLEETPVVLRQAIQRELRGGKCGEIYKTTEEGDVSYDVSVIANGKTRLLTFDSAGSLVYQAEPIQLSEAPIAVQQALRGQLQNAKLASVEKAIEDGELTYEVELIKAGKRQSLSIKPDGQVVQPE